MCHVMFQQSKAWSLPKPDEFLRYRTFAQILVRKKMYINRSEYRDSGNLCQLVSAHRSYILPMFIGHII
jgi:hypothetical protein